MKLGRDLLEQYLDGELEAGQKRQVEQALAADAVAAGLLARLRQERTLRQAAFRTYEPAPAEAAAQARHMLEALAEREHAPLARLGPTRYLRWAGAAAAALLLVAGSFYAGRATSTPLVTVKTEYNVVTFDDFGRPVAQSFQNLDEAIKFARDIQPHEALASTEDGTIMF